VTVCCGASCAHVDVVRQVRDTVVIYGGIASDGAAQNNFYLFSLTKKTVDQLIVAQGVVDVFLILVCVVKLTR
jgi:hypothetical protein